MAHLVSAKARRGHYNGDIQPVVTLVVGAETEDEAREMGRNQLFHQTGRLVTVEEVKRLRKPGIEFDRNLDPEEPWYEKTLVAFDVETTGLDPTEDIITEVGFAVRKPESDGFGEVSSFLLGDADEVPEDITEFTGISTEMIADKPTFAEAFEDKIQPFLDEADALVAHNRGFDCSFLLQTMIRSEVLHPVPPFFCTWEMAKDRGGFEKEKLQVIREDFGIKEGDAHRAGDDARVCGEVFLELARQLEYFRPPCTMRDCIDYFDHVQWTGEPASAVIPE